MESSRQSQFYTKRNLNLKQSLSELKMKDSFAWWFKLKSSLSLISFHNTDVCTFIMQQLVIINVKQIWRGTL